MDTTKDTTVTDKAAQGASRLADTLTRIESRLGTGPNPDDLFGDGTEGASVAVGQRSYNATKSVAQHVKFRTEVRDEHGRPAMTRSELDNAKTGAYLKRIAQRAGIDVAWREEDDALMEECYKSPWCGLSGGEWHDQAAAPISGSRAKALLDDAPSGGIEINPIFFDSDIVQTMLLTGELSPFVDTKPVPRGRRVDGSSIGSPTVQWAHQEGTAANLFSTASFISAIDTTIFAVVVAIEVGRDLLADSPSNVGAQLVEAIAQRMASELDLVIATGDGATQPEGIFTASGLTTVNTDNAAAGPATLNDYETLMFSIGKQFRNSAMRPAFISNDTSYQRRTSIRIDTATPSTDQRPVFGMTHNDYSTLGWPHRVQNDIGNRSVAYGSLGRYRLYRRQGLSVEWFREGEQLARKNTTLLVVRSRYGGTIRDTNAFAKWTDGQS